MRILRLLVYFTFASGKAHSQNNNQIIINRIALIYNLKESVGKNTWVSFASKDYELPLIYYTDSSSFIANPSKRFLKQFPCELLFKSNKVNIFKLTSRLDKLPFHMEVSLTMGANTGAFDYHYPIIKCSGFNESKRIISNLHYNAWLAMIIHECFHVYQYNHKTFAENAFRTNTLQSFIGDSLQNLYKLNTWFKKEVDEENKDLILAADAHNKKATDSLINKFLLIRNKRREETKKRFNLQIETYEKTFETLEGTARYIEAATLKLFNNEYRLDNGATNHSVNAEPYTKPAWLYSTQVSDRYFYATGYNITKLLEKLRIQYKILLFRNGKLTLEGLLRNFVYKRERDLDKKYGFAKKNN